MSYEAHIDFKYERTTTMNGVYDNAFTITSLEDNNTIAFIQDLRNAGFIYSLDGGMSWQSVTSATICTLDAGESVMIRNTSTILGAFASLYNGLFSTKMKDFNVSGNIMSLCTEDYNNFNSLHYVDEDEGIDFYFDDILRCVFMNTNVVDASALILPATTLAHNCYGQMFKGCTKLVNAPKLPATTLAYSCYKGMFEGCTSLKGCPALPATVLPGHCYDSMFKGCTSIVSAPNFPDFEFFGDSESQCLSMFEGCTGIISGPTLSCDNLHVNCYKKMFEGCTSMVNPPVLPATNLAYGCYMKIFNNCTSLVNAPDLPAIDLPEKCYDSMFKGCTNLSYIKIYAINRESNSLDSWVSNVAPTGVFVKQQGVTYPIDSINGVPIGWTVYELGDQIYDIYDVTLSVNPSQSGTVTGAGKYMRNTNVTVTALPNNNYLFDHWEVDGVNVSNDNIYTFRMNYDIHLTAKFVTDTNNYANMYFTIESLTNNNSIYIRTYETDSPFKIYYKINDVWTSYEISNPTNRDILIVTLNRGDKLCLASNKSTWDVPYTTAETNGGRIVTTGNYSVYGNLLSMTLYDEEEENDDSVFSYDEYYEVPVACFRNFFRGTTSNVSNLLNAANLSLPAYTVNEQSYASMFQDCTKLLYAPKSINASTLANSCYHSMFRGCASMVTIPTLNATVLANSCYAYMFYGCLSLPRTPYLPATTLAYSCYKGMFQDCISLTATRASLPATTLADECCFAMYQGCTNLTSVPILNATSMAYRCYAYMFANCTSLVTPPVLSATTLSANCYESMFEGCTSLTTAPALSATTLRIYCYKYMFNGCISLVTAPDLPATELKQGCYQCMFYDCENLNYIKILATTRATDDLQNWVHNVAPSGIFVKDFNTTYLIDNDSGVPIGWTITDTNTPATYYNVTIINDHPECGDVFGAGRYEAGTTVRVRAVAAQNYSFKNWIYNGVTISQNADFSFTASQDVTLIVVWDIEHDYEHEYITIESLVDNNRISLEGNWNEYGNNYGAGTIQYCINDNQYWTTYNLISMSYDKESYVCILNEGDRIKLKNVQFVVPWSSSDSEYSVKLYIRCSKYYNVYGNIMSLYDAHINNEQSTITYYVGNNLSTLSNSERFSNMFAGTVVSAKNLILPATTLSPYCYAGMFSGGSLLDVPELPATTLAKGCYSNMFYGCTSLPSIPNDLLPATTLTEYCYASMFARCSSLVSIPSGLLPATTLAYSCYLDMFNMMSGNNYYYDLQPTALTTVPSDLLPATTLTDNCYMRMFAGCTSLTTAPDLPATLLKEQCYASMFMACTSLTTAPDLPATGFSQAQRRPYSHMFEYCTSLNYIKAMFEYTTTNNLYGYPWTEGWVNLVSSTGTFVRNVNADMNRIDFNDSGIPAGWTVQTASE